MRPCAKMWYFPYHAWTSLQLLEKLFFFHFCDLDQIVTFSIIHAVTSPPLAQKITHFPFSNQLSNMITCSVVNANMAFKMLDGERWNGSIFDHPPVTHLLLILDTRGHYLWMIKKKKSSISISEGMMFRIIYKTLYSSRLKSRQMKISWRINSWKTNFSITG